MILFWILLGVFFALVLAGFAKMTWDCFFSKKGW